MSRNARPVAETILHVGGLPIVRTTWFVLWVMTRCPLMRHPVTFAVSTRKHANHVCIKQHKHQWTHFVFFQTLEYFFSFISVYQRLNLNFFLWIAFESANYVRLLGGQRITYQIYLCFKFDLSFLRILSQEKNP